MLTKIESDALIAELVADVMVYTEGTTPPPVESPDGFKVPDNGTTLYDSALAKWELGAGGAHSGKLILKNGVQWNGGEGNLLEYKGKKVYTLAGDGNWYVDSGSAWVLTTDPNDVVPPSGLLPSRGFVRDDGGASRDNGLVDMIDTAKVPAPIPWSLFVDDTGTLARSMNGVEATQYVRMPVCGHNGGLYLGTPHLFDGAIRQYYPDKGISIPDSILPKLNADPMRYRSGVRGEHIFTPYVTSHGHPRRKEDGTISTEGPDVIPTFVGIVLDGMMQFEFANGRIAYPGKVAPLKSYATDFSYHLPRGDQKFWATDAGVGELLLADRNTFAAEFWCGGMGRAVSVREVDAQVYVADESNGKVWHVTGKGAKTALCSLQGAFYIDYFSDSKRLLVIDSALQVWEVDTTTGTPRLIVPMRPDRNFGQQWQTISVDRGGVWGEVDSFVVCTVVGPANTDVWRYHHTGAQFDPATLQGLHMGDGVMNVGLANQVTDTYTHYPWDAKFHPEQGILRVVGNANSNPAYILPFEAINAWNPGSYGAHEQLINDGWILQYGWPNLLGTPGNCGAWPITPLPTDRPHINAQMNPLGSGLWNADHVGLMSFDTAAAFLRAGGIGSWPRTYSNYALKAHLFYLIRNSQEFLRRGDVLVQEFFAWASVNLP